MARHWKAISPDLSREHSGQPESLYAAFRQRDSREAARRDLLGCRIVSKHRYALGGNGRWFGLDHPGSGQELEEHHTSGAHPVEQDHADQRIEV